MEAAAADGGAAAATRDPIVVRRAARTDAAAILDLVRASLGEGTIPRTAEYWRWKHEESPAGASPVLVAEADGQLVGLRAFMRWRWRAHGVDVPAVRAVDTATHPDWQGRGIFKRLTLQLRTDMDREGAAFVFNTPNAQSRPGYLKMGWSLAGRPTMWMRPRRPLRLARVALSRDLRGEGEPPQVQAAPAAEVLAMPAVRALLAAGVREPIGRLHTPATREHLAWRYAGVPGFAYQAVVRGEGTDAALLLLRARQRGALRELRLCDAVVGPTPAARRNLGALVRCLGALADVDMLVGMASGRPVLQRALAAAGFVPLPRTGPILTVHPLAAVGAPHPARLASWAATVGDLELF